MFKFFSRKKVTETLYQQNLELAVKNKTLSLLEKLYETSVLTLTPQEMASKITETIRHDLNLELAGVLIFNKETDTLEPLAFSKSQRLLKVLKGLGFLFQDITITHVSYREFFKKVIYNHEDNITSNLQDVWQELVNQDNVEKIKKESHIKTMLLYPLIKGSEVLGILLLGFNRDYQTLNTFEKASIKSFINVIALLLEKSYLYKDLQNSYEVTKKAYAIEKQAKEELEKLDKYKNDFLRQTQHDLRSPLTIIMGYSDLLLSGSFGKLPKKAAGIIEKMQTVTKNKIKDVNNFLDIEQFKMGKGVVSLTPGVLLMPLLEEIVNVLGPKATSKGIYLTLHKPEEKITVSIDTVKMKAALFNIIDNAIKYTPKGGVDITIEKNKKIKIIISDTGIGIPKDSIESIFTDQFKRTKQAEKTASGSGVGLPLSSQIIILHQGRVWAESEGDGKGSRFYIELPISK